MNFGFSGEMIFLFFLALILFGPKKMPEIGRQVARFLGEFRRASNEFRSQIESEINSLDNTRQRHPGSRSCRPSRLRSDRWPTASSIPRRPKGSMLQKMPPPKRPLSKPPLPNRSRSKRPPFSFRACPPKVAPDA